MLHVGEHTHATKLDVHPYYMFRTRCANDVQVQKIWKTFPKCVCKYLNQKCAKKERTFFSKNFPKLANFLCNSHYENFGLATPL